MPKSYNNVNIGKVIAEHRSNKGILQKDLAEDLQITQSYLSLIENGHVKPGIILLYKLSVYFKKPFPVILYQGLGITANRGNRGKSDFKAINMVVEPVLLYLMTGEKKLAKVKTQFPKGKYKYR